jgi:phospholipid transport system substrate-binding protein
MTYISQKMTGFLLLVIACLALMFQPALAETKPKDPRVLVQEVAGELFAVAKANPGEKASSEAYFNQIESILERVVDFPFIAYVVMGESGKKATDAQKKQFAEVFKSGLVRSYAKGIAAYADSEIKILPSNIDPKKPTSVVVKQEVTDQGNIHHLAYSMRLNKKTNEWKLINVTLNGVNLGQSFRSQFSQALAKQGGDIDKVISTWLSEA